MTSQSPIERTSKINVLSIDGGGIRGVIPARILTRLEERLQRPLHEVFDLIAGTSTGGIIALGIATASNNGQPYRPADILRLYIEHGPRIFRKRWYNAIKTWFRPKYSPRALEETLDAYFKRAELSAALTPLLVSSYDLQSQVPFFFKSHKIAQEPTYNWKLTEVARATSAAPTFFPPSYVSHDGESYALIDGGIFVNNPGMAAYAEARRLYPQAAEFVMVSVGTGDRHDQLTYKQARSWGLVGWARQIVPVIMDSVSEAVDYELSWIVGTSTRSKHYRIQPDLKDISNEMDNASPENIDRLCALAEKYLMDNAPLIEEICVKLRPGRGSAMRGTGSPDIKIE